MESDAPHELEEFEAWLMCRVAQAVEVGEIPADLLAGLEAEFDTSREKSPEQSHSDAAHDISVELQMPIEKVEAGLAALEAQPRVIRELLMRRLAERWLEGQRAAPKHAPRRDG